MMARALNISGNSDWEMVAVKTTCGELTFHYVQLQRKDENLVVTYPFCLCFFL